VNDIIAEVNINGSANPTFNDAKKAWDIVKTWAHLGNDEDINMELVNALDENIAAVARKRLKND
jgi:hypothetical protein